MKDDSATTEAPRGVEELGAEFARLEAALAALRDAPAPEAPAAAAPAHDGDRDALAAELAAERDANAQLEDRIRIVRRRGEATAARLQAEADEAAARLEEAEADLRRALAVAEALRATSAELRAACAAGMIEGSQIDAAMEAELAAQTAAHEADRKEVDAALEELRPLVAAEDS